MSIASSSSSAVPATPLRQVQRRPSVETTVDIDYNRHPNLQAYCEELKKLQNYRMQEKAQKARQMLKMLQWSVVDYKSLIDAGWKVESPKSSTKMIPCFNIKLVLTILMENRNDNLSQVESILQNLLNKGEIYDNNDDSILVRILKYPLQLTNPSRLLKYYYSKFCDIDTLTVIEAISAVISYSSSSRNSPT
ncbi:hypothetical protein GLOIN_2v1543548 [Rhizophagus clarus]|nr:hypothetical protein GLOIN_2v1543548 [Rhizophagus clarus]